MGVGVNGAQTLRAEVPVEVGGQRLDQVLATLFGDYSRARLQRWVRDGRVSVDGAVCDRPRERVSGGERIEIRVEAEADTSVAAEAIPLNVVYQDEALLVIDKPAGLVVHPAAGNPDGTLQNALLYLAPELAEVPRSGIVHRLDKETSGLLVVARTLSAHKYLVEQLQAREIGREYQAVANGVLVSGGTVDAPIGRHPVDRKRMAVVERGKPAVTHYRVIERFRAHTHVRVRLETGRTHQIRVHMAHIRHPLLGDPVYGGRLRLPPAAAPELIATLRGFRRQALHAARLELAHPVTGETMVWESALPADMERLLAALREDLRRQGEGA